MSKKVYTVHAEFPLKPEDIQRMADSINKTTTAMMKLRPMPMPKPEQDFLVVV